MSLSFGPHLVFAVALISAACATPSEPVGTSSEGRGEGSQERRSPDPTTPGKNANATHLLITLKMTPAALQVLSARTVAIPLPTLRAPQPEPWRVDVEDAGGRALFSVPLAAPNVLRGEFAGDGRAVDGVHFRTQDAAFPIRIPVLAGAVRLRVWGLASTLDPRDPRAQHRRADEMVELGAVDYPRISP